MDIVSMILMIIGALIWGIIGVAQYDVIAAIFGGTAGDIARIIYTIIGLSGIWGIVMLFKRGRVSKKHPS